jgi:hypothetical protein
VRPHHPQRRRQRLPGLPQPQLCLHRGRIDAHGYEGRRSVLRLSVYLRLVGALLRSARSWCVRCPGSGSTDNGAGADEAMAHSSIRFGMGRFTTEKEVDFVTDKIVNITKKLRDMSPLYEMVLEGASSVPAAGFAQRGFRHRFEDDQLGSALIAVFEGSVCIVQCICCCIFSGTLAPTFSGGVRRFSGLSDRLPKS